MPKLMRLTAIGTAACLLLNASATAIVMRHDRPASRYRELGARYPAVGTIGGRVAGTLIDRRWVLGAGHTVERYFNPLGRPFVTFAGTRYEVDKIIVHPQRIKDAVDSDYDLALLRLARPVEGIDPVKLYQGRDEWSKLVTIAGPGENGVGTNRENRSRPGDIYGAHNRIDGVFERSLIMTFSRPPGGEDLEGIAGAGDSGCPALLEIDGSLYTLGVGSWNSGEEATASTYETVDAFARVSAHREWILDTMRADPPSTVPIFTGPRALSSPEQIPDTPAGLAARALLEAFNDGSPEALESFYVRFGRKRTTEELKSAVAQWPPLIEQYGRYQLEGCSEAGPNTIVLIVRASRGNIRRGVAVTVDPATGKTTSMMMADLNEE